VDNRKLDLDESASELADLLGPHESMFKQIDCLWQFFVKSNDSFSSASVSKFFGAFFKNGLQDIRVILWAYSRFGLDTTRAVGQKLRDVARGPDSEDESEEEEETECLV
jgi:hypothetical protein